MECTGVKWVVNESNNFAVKGKGERADFFILVYHQ